MTRKVEVRRLRHSNNEGLGIDEMLWFAAPAKLHSTEVDKAGANNCQRTSTNSTQNVIKPRARN